MAPPLLLLIDDAPEITFLVRRLARQAGQEVIACRDVPQALARLETVQPDLAVVDVNLPGASGLEFCALLRRLPGREKTPVALFSHLRRIEDVAAGLEAGVDFILQKDLLADPNSWHARMEEILTACRGGANTDPLQYVARYRFLALPGDGIPALNDALRHPAVMRFGSPVLQILLGRVVQRLAQTLKSLGGPPATAAIDSVSSWLQPDGPGLTPAAFPVSGRSGWVAACGAALAEEMSTVWGIAAAGAACEVLTRTVAGEH